MSNGIRTTFRGFVIEDLEKWGWLNRDERGFLVAGEKLQLHYGLSDE